MKFWISAEGRKRKIAIVVLSFMVAVLSGFLLVNIVERKQEAKNPFFRVVELDDATDDPAIWGKNFPHQYDAYMRTVDQVRTRFGGSEAMPRTPSEADPRSVVSQSKLEEDPRLKRIWAGYAFAKDFREERGHAYMLSDQLYTGRHAVAQPGTCINCHASTYKAMKELGNGDLHAGFMKLNSLPYFEAAKHVSHPITCLDCHEPKTMQLRVTRPAFMEGIKALKSHQGVKDFDVNRDATHQEMRTFVCAQCHVEYYFKGKEKTLTYPWFKGNRGDEILSYYEETGFKDWVHAETQTPALKAQHPEFEMWSQGVHARSGVSCADCHMPFQRVGAMKVSDHHVQSPMLQVNRACQTCHSIPERDLHARVQLIQQNHLEMRDRVMDAVVELIDELKAESQNPARSDAVKKAQQFHRKAQFLLDFVEAENSTGFHAPQEAARLLNTSLDYVRKGQNALK